MKPAETEFLLALFFEKLRIPLEIDFFSLENKDFLHKVAVFPISNWLGYLNTIENLIKSFNFLIYPFLKKLIIVIFAMMKILKLYKENTATLEQSELQRKFFKGKLKEINRNILKRFSEIYAKFHDFCELEVITKAFLMYKSGKIEKMAGEAKGNDGLLAVFEVWSEKDEYQHYFVEYPYLKNAIFSMYSAKKLTQKTVEFLNKIVLNLLGFSHEERIEEEKEENFAIKSCGKLAICEKMAIDPLLRQSSGNLIEAEFDVKSRIFDAETVRVLLENIENFCVSAKNLNKSQKKRWRPSLSLVRILLRISQLSVEISDEILDRFLLLFLPLIDYKYLLKAQFSSHSAKNQKQLVQNEKNSTISFEILKTFAQLLGLKQRTTNLPRFFNHVVNLVLNLQGQKFRFLLVEILTSLDLTALGLTRKSVDFFKNLNIFERGVSRNYDAQLVIPLILQFNLDVLTKDFYSIEDISLILCHFFSVLEDNEMSMRGSALSGFSAFFEFLRENWCEIAEDARKSAKKFIQMVLIPNALRKIQKNVKTKQEFKIKSFFLLFDCVLQGLFALESRYKILEESERAFFDLSVIMNKTDPDQDFFPMIFDVKISRKIKAINLLNKKLKENAVFSVESSTKALIPLLNYVIFTKSLEINDPSNKMPKSAVTISNYRTLLENAIESFALLTRDLRWGNYMRVLKTLMNKLVKSENAEEKVVVKLVCAVLNNLSFELNDIVSIVAQEMKTNKEKILKRISVFSNENLERNQEEMKENYEEIKEKIDEEKNVEISKKNEILIERNTIRFGLEGGSLEEKERNSMYYFLRAKVLVPLKHHMFEAKKNRNLEGEDQKVRIFLTVAIVKVFLNFFIFFMFFLIDFFHVFFIFFFN